MHRRLNEYIFRTSERSVKALLICDSVLSWLIQTVLFKDIFHAKHSSLCLSTFVNVTITGFQIKGPE
jgi:hypothetical protein